MFSVEEVKREVKKWLDEGFVVVVGWVSDVLALAAMAGEKDVEAYMVNVTLLINGCIVSFPSGLLVASFKRTEKLRRALRVRREVFNSMKLVLLERKEDSLNAHVFIDIEDDNRKLASQLCEEIEAHLSEKIGKQLEKMAEA